MAIRDNNDLSEHIIIILYECRLREEGLRVTGYTT